MADQEIQPDSDLAQFGEELRREREIRGISLKEIADATKVSKRFLEALERNEHKTLPAPAFTRGFVRQYAIYLGLNSDELVDRYNQAASRDDRIEKPQFQHVSSTVPPMRERVRAKKGIPPAYARVDRNVYFLIAIVVALGSLIWWGVKYKHEHDRESESTKVAVPLHPVTLSTASAAPATPARTASTGGVPVALQAASGTAAPIAPINTNPDTLHLTVELLDTTYLILEIDGKNALNDELRKGERRTYEAKERFRFQTIGNAAGLQLTFENVKVPPLGTAGQVIHDRVFDRDYLQKASQTEPRSGT